MKRLAFLVLCAAAAMPSFTHAATPGRTATEAYVTNKVDAAAAATLQAAKNYTDTAISSVGNVTPEMVTNIVHDVSPTPDFSTNNTTLVETIEATAPAPGEYAAVSNAAMNALSRAEAEAGFTEWVMPDGAESRYYIDYFNNSWVLRNISDDEPIASEYAPTDAVSVTFSEEWLIPNPLTITRTRLPTMADTTLTPIYSQTPTFSEWTFSDVSDGITDIQQPTFIPSPGGEPRWDIGFDYKGQASGASVYSSDKNATNLAFEYSDEGLNLHLTATRTRTDIIGYTLGSQTDKPIASTNDLARASAIPSVVTNIVRDLSLGGIWDESIQVWWTPRMRNGSLTYEATTNVNLNAEN